MLATGESDVTGVAAADMDAVSKATLTNRHGVRYYDFRRTLAPKYYRVWLELLAGHAGIVAIAVLVAMTPADIHPVPLTLVGAVLLGYLIAYVQLFLHEAAHYNLARSRRANDLLANVFIGALVGQAIASYRPIHFDHHRHLGEPGDTERTYFDPLNLRFFLESVSGVKPFKVLRARQKVPVGHSQERAGPSRWLVPLASVVLNGGVVTLAISRQWYWLALAWPIGLIVFYPMFGALRQLLEHRDDNASPDIDYSVKPHGAVNRLFGDSFLARTFGAAGFNRHLLHHWEPQISYTRLADLDRYLQDTEIAAYLERHRATYTRTFVRLFTLY